MYPDRKTWKIGSGTHLAGTAHLHGNKNTALPCMAAALLLPLGGRLVLEHMPRISDVTILGDILGHLGITTRWQGPQTLELLRRAPAADRPDIPADLTARIRGSIVLLGPLAGLYGSFTLPKPGGDRIGGRPISAHITALNDVGVTVTDLPGRLACSRNGPVRGGTVVLTEQSVTATLLLLLYSAFLPTQGHMTVMDAACEPHVTTLCALLESMGAHIQGTASNLLTISWPAGRREPDRPLRLDDDFMEAATYALAAAITRSDLVIPFRRAAVTLHLIDRYLGWMGIHTRLDADAWHILGSRSGRVITPSLTVIKAEPWPRFPTDIMSMFVVLATQCTGTLTFIEYMYDDRFGFVQALRDTGACIRQMPPHAITVSGPTPLSGNEMFLRPDIRSGAAMLLAALAASGTTILHDRGGVIERGYQDLPETLATLGAPIERVGTPFD